MYSLSGYGSMLLDSARVEGVLEALKQAIYSKQRQEVIRVLDLGAGFGFFAIAAAKMSDKVEAVAIEPTKPIKLAKKLAVQNGVEIEAIRALSFDYESADPFDIIIADIHGRLPLLPYYYHSLIDARRRLLAPGGALIPQRDVLWMAPVSSQRVWEKHFTLPWTSNHHGVDLSSLVDYIRDSWIGLSDEEDIKGLKFLSPPVRILDVDHRKNDKVNHHFSAEYKIGGEGVMHGFAAWFAAELSPGTWVSSLRDMQQAKKNVCSDFTELVELSTCENSYGGPVILPLVNEVEVSGTTSVHLDNYWFSGPDDYAWHRMVCVEEDGKSLYNYDQNNVLFPH